MPKISKCDRCSFYAHDPHLICAIHPGGVENDCLDFRDNGREAELWSPQGYVWYGDNLQAVGRSRLTNEQRLEILDTHPLFTGKCPSCGHKFENYPLIHWDCPNCGWIDESV